MANAAVGERVGVIIGSEKKLVRVAGFGVRLPDCVPGPEAAGFMADILREMDRPNPCLLLDSGEKAWGCEVWWASEVRVREILDEATAGGASVETVTMAAARSGAG